MRQSPGVTWRSLAVRAACVVWLVRPALAAPAPGPLLIVQRTPDGRTESRYAVRAITVTFNQPMVALSDNEAMGTLCPIRLEPPVPGRCRWRGTNTLTFEPATPLPPASRFRAMVPKGVKSLVTGAVLDREVAWEFESLRPQLQGSVPHDGAGWVTLDPVLYLAFSLPVSPARARPFIELRETPLEGQGAGVVVPVAVRGVGASEYRSAGVYGGSWDDEDSGPGGRRPELAVIAVKPQRSLKRDHAYALSVREGLPPARGTLGLHGTRVVRFETWYTFRLDETPEGACLPAWFRIGFSNPVRMGDLLDALHGGPALKSPELDDGAREQTGSQDRRARRVTMALPAYDFKPDTVYTFTVSGKLKDVFGNPLGEDRVFSFATDWLCPRLGTPEGFGILEGDLPARHPVTVLNVPEVPFRLAAVPEDLLIPLHHDLGWSSGSGGDTAAIRNAAERIWKPDTPRNVRRRTFLDLEGVLGKGKGGFAFLTLAFRDPESRNSWRWTALDNVTKVGITFKSAPEQTLVAVTRLADAGPASGVPVELRDQTNRIVWKGKTDSQGFASAPGWQTWGLGGWNAHGRPQLWAFARAPGGTAVMSTDWRGELEPWRFGVNYEWSPAPETYRAELFTDRGVYRPGEPVHVRAVVRRLVAGDWTACDLRSLGLSVRDSRGTEIVKTTLPVAGGLGAHFTFTVSGDAPTGSYRIHLQDVNPAAVAGPVVRVVDDGMEIAEEDSGEDGGGRGAAVPADPGAGRRVNESHSFRVEAFKPASFEVKVTPAPGRLVAGGTYRAVIDGWYLFGAPMAEAPADWHIRLERAWYEPPGREGFEFSPGWWDEDGESSGRSGGALAAGTAKLDGAGKLTVTAWLDPAGFAGAMTVAVEAGVASPERQRLFGRAAGIAHAADLYVGVKPARGFVGKGEAWSAGLIAVRPDGGAVAGRPVTWTLTRREWLSTRRAGFAGRLEWVSERRDTVAASGTILSAAEPRPVEWTPDRPGFYLFEARARDEAGRATRAATSFYVTGKGEAWWERRDTDIVELVPDRKGYKPGDTAKILVKSPFAKCRALVTVERETILERRVVELEGGATQLEVPIKESYLPNVYVGVALLTGRAGEAKFSEDGEDMAKPQGKFGYVNLAVDPGSRRFAVAVEPDRTSYRPGQPVTLSLSTRDDEGKPAASSLTVFAVDEGVLALTGYRTPDLFAAFYGPRPLLVATADSRLFVIGQRSYGEKGKNRGGGGGAGAELGGIDLRTKFVPTAYWNPAVRTGDDGKAQVTFTLPDNLSAFRLMAVAESPRRFGGGEARITVSKPLLLRPSLPRHARAGDRFSGGVVVHNYGPAAVEVTLGLEVAGGAVAVEGELIRKVPVGAGRAAEVTWSCRAVKLGEAAFRFRAAAGADTDGLEWKVPVRAPEKLETVATSGVADPEAVEALLLPEGALDGPGGVRIAASSSALAGLEGAATYLLGYPYGCLEQKLSRAMPVFVAADLIETFKLGDLGGLKAAARQVISRLRDFQHSSGGFMYWTDGHIPDPWLTAYALEVAAMAKREGVEPEPVVLERAVRWLRGWLAGRDEWGYPYAQSESYAARAYAVYALSLHGTPMPSVFDALFERRDQIPFLAKAYLVKAAPAVSRDGKTRETVANELLAQARFNPRTIHFEEPAETRGWWVHDSTVRTTAICLQALLEARGGFGGDEKAVAWLTGERKGSGRWRSTQENTSSLRALQDFYRRYEREEPDFTGRLTLQPGRALWSEPFKGRSLTARTREFGFGEIFAAGKRAMLSFVREGRGRLYYSLSMRYAPARFTKPAAEGLEITRSVRPLNGPAGGPIKAGARAVVTLTVKSDADRTFVAVEDPLPGGFEIVDPSFATESREDERQRARAEADAGRRRWWWWGDFHRSEKYDDRIQVFADFLTAGEHTYTYLVQATTPGAFAWPAAWAEMMYEPEVFGRTASDAVTIVP